MKATRTFQRSSSQIPLVRRFVRETVEGWGEHGVDDVTLQDLVLMASELFTNAVLHGAGTVEVTVSLAPRCVHLAVSDEGTHEVPRQPRLPRVDMFTGRGLQIVDRLAAAWGSGRNHAGGTVVWLEVPRT